MLEAIEGGEQVRQKVEMICSGEKGVRHRDELCWWKIDAVSERSRLGG
jgi:hypothetical protein